MIYFGYIDRKLYTCNTNEGVINPRGGNIKMNIININPGICMTKIKMIRPENNLKSRNLNLNVDWAVEYKEDTEKPLEYTCNLKTIGEFPITFAVQGFVGLKSNEKFEKISGDLSRMILDKSMNVMVNMINVTRDTPLDFKACSNSSVDDDLKIILKEMI